jgi:hypothetical protein
MEKLLFKKEGGCYVIKRVFLGMKGSKIKKTKLLHLAKQDVLFRHPEMYPWQAALQQSLLPFNLQCKCKPYLGLLKNV